MKIETKKISILGSEWTIRSGTHETDKELDEYTGGVTDVTTREIIVKDIPADEVEMRDEPANIRRIIRHEIIHAFLYECGLFNDAMGSGAWPMNEEMVDWIAIQHEKLHKAFLEANALDDGSGAVGPHNDAVYFADKLTDEQVKRIATIAGGSCFRVVDASGISVEAHG